MKNLWEWSVSSGCSITLLVFLFKLLLLANVTLKCKQMSWHFITLLGFITFQSGQVHILSHFQVLLQIGHDRASKVQ